MACLVVGRTKKEILERMKLVLERCKENKIMISDSIQHGTEVQFAGHIINGQGSKPDQDKVKAIEDFHEPETITDLGSFIGLAN